MPTKFCSYKLSSYICSVIKNKEIMTTQELNIVNALETAKEVLSQMIGQGLGETKFVFALSNMLIEKFNLTQNQSIIVIEEALKIV